jgi:hypothetical protein
LARPSGRFGDLSQAAEQVALLGCAAPAAGQHDAQVDHN